MTGTLKCGLAALVLVAWGVFFPTASSAVPETITISYWGDDFDTLAGDLLPDFESLHDGSDGKPIIKVILGQSASIDKTTDPQRLVSAVAGGDPPDLVFFDRFAVGEWALRRAFMPLQDFLERDLRERPDDPFTMRSEQFFEPCWAEACYEGQLFAVPTTTDNRAFYYNKDILEKHASELIPIGCVDPNDPTKVGPPRTWEQLKKAAELLTQRDAGGRLKAVGFIPNFGNSWLYIYGWLNGGSFLSEDGRTSLLNAPEIVGALTYMTELYDIMGGAQDVTAFQSTLQTGDLDPFLSGKVAMKIDCDQFINGIANMKRDLRFGVSLAPAPEGNKQLGWCGGYALVIPAGAKNPEEAWELAKYLASQRAYKISADAGRQLARAGGNVFIPRISARRDVTEWAMQAYLYDDSDIDAKFKEGMRTFVDAMPFSKYRPVTPVGQLLWNSQVRGMEDGMYKRYDKTDARRNAQIALDFHSSVIQKELDNLYHPPERRVISFKPVVVTYAILVLVGMAAMYWYFGRRMQAKGYFRQEYYAGYAFASPWLLGFIIFGGGPILFSLFMSFCEYDVLTPPRFAGLDNFRLMFTDDPLFAKSLWNTIYMSVSIPLGMLLSLCIAMLLSFEIKGMAIYRTFFYLPAIMPAVAASILWIWVFNPNEGILNTLLGSVGIQGPAWLQNEVWSKPALIVMALWGAGGGMIVWLAGLKGIPTHLYEAAELDGAGKLSQFWNITLPMLSPYILFNLIMGIIGTFQKFTEAFIMTKGGPVDSTLFYAFHLFNHAFRYMKMGYASALAWVLFGIVLVLTVINLWLSKRWVHYESDT